MSLNTSHGMLMRLDNCTGMIHRGHELIVWVTVRAENTPAQYVIARFEYIVRTSGGCSSFTDTVQT